MLVKLRKLDHSIVVAATSQWRRRLSACVRAHGGHFERVLWYIFIVQYIKLMPRIFEFGV